MQKISKKRGNGTKQSEQRLLALMRATSDVIYRMSPDWKTMTELYGRGFLADTERPDPSWLNKYIHPDDQAYVTQVIESCIQDKRVFELEHRVLRADGSIGWTYSRAVPLLDENGGIMEWIGAASDVTGRKRAEEALKESEAKYHDLFESIDEGYCIIEVLFDSGNRPLDYRFLEVNDSFEKQTGIVNAADRLMRDIAPGHEQHWFDTYGHIALTGEPARFQSPAKALGYFYDVYAYRVGKPEQRRVAILFNDITDRKKAEEALLEKSRQLEETNQQKEDILESICDCFYALDKELRFTYANKAAEEIWGIPRAQLLGNRIEDVFPGLIDLSLSKFRQALEEQTSQHYEVFSKVIQRWGEMSVHPTRDGISVYFRDTTERKRVEEALRESEAQARAFSKKLEEADRNKNQFISALSHELRNPLAVIMTGLELLCITEDQKQLASTKEILNRQMKQICALVDDLMDLTRISNNRIELKKERVELNRLAFLTAEDQQGLFQEKGVRLYTRTSARPLHLDADPVRLKQIIGNLLHNALKYTNAGGEAVLSVFEEGGEAVISIKDNGIGLDPDILPRLFQPFVQADMSLDRSGGGLGLGLSITKGIAELHGGSVSAKSGGPGKGSEFMIRLPVSGITEQDAAGEKKQTETATHSLKILMIEDNKDFADLMCAMLTPLGHQVMVSYNGYEGVEKAKRFQPDIIFCDIGLPGMDGFEVAKAIKENDSLKNALLVALTGYAGEDILERAKESGFDRHIAKPVSLAALKQFLNAH